MSPNDNRIDARDWSLLAVLSVLWGGSFFFNGAALRELPPLTLVFLRVALGAAILLPLLRMQGIGLPKGMAGWKPFVAIGLLNNVIPFSLIVIGQTFHPERAGLDPECDHAAVHGDGDGGGRRRGLADASGGRRGARRSPA